ncbi:MAG: hypothetical protein ACI9TF_000913 [Paracrocinitomix sp.]
MPRVEADDLQVQDTMSDASRDSELADELDAMDAERVMQRALELEAESAHGPHVITTEQLDQIAKEVGVDPAFVHQALGELRLKAPDQGRFAKWMLGGSLAETATLTALTRADVDASVTKWMTQHEGMIAGGAVPGGVAWHVDRRWRSRVLSRSMSGGNRISRVTGDDLTHRVHSLNDDEHVVAMQSEGRWPLTFATLVLAVGATSSSLLLLGLEVANGLLLGLGLVAGSAATTVGVAVGCARWWARATRRALRRSLTGLASSAKPKRSSWLSRRRKKRGQSW